MSRRILSVCFILSIVLLALFLTWPQAGAQAALPAAAGTNSPTPGSQPDLVISAVVGQQNGLAASGCALSRNNTLLVTVQNIGSAAAGVFEVSATGRAQANQAIPSLAAGASITLTFSELPTDGVNVITVDSTGLVAESQEGNNSTNYNSPTLAVTCTVTPTPIGFISPTPTRTGTPVCAVSGQVAFDHSGGAGLVNVPIYLANSTGTPTPALAATTGPYGLYTAGCLSLRTIYGQLPGFTFNPASMSGNANSFGSRYVPVAIANGVPTYTTTPTGPSPTPTPTATATTPAASGALSVLINKGNGTDNNQQTGFNFLVKNSGASALSNLSTRIYFTTDGSNAASGYVLEKYYDQSGVASYAGPTLACGSTYYYTVTYGTASLAAGAQWEIQSALHLSSWANTYDGGNDFYHTGYAVGALPASYTNTASIPGYVGGVLSTGTTPACGPTPTTGPTNTPTRTASATSSRTLTATNTSAGPTLTPTRTATRTITPIGPTATPTRTPTVTNTPMPPTRTITPTVTATGATPTQGASNTGNATWFTSLGQPYGGCGITQTALDSQNFVALNVQNSPGDYTTFHPRPISSQFASVIGLFNNGLNCGRWVKVTISDNCLGTNDGAQNQPFCRGGAGFTADQYNGATLDMIVADSCYDSNAWCRDDPFHLDLAQGSLNLFVKNGVPVGNMYPGSWNNRHIQWQFEQAPNYTGDINIGFIQGAQVWWTPIAITHLLNGIHGVDYFDGTNWVKATMDSDMGQTYLIGPTVAAGSSYQIRVYDVNNQLINNGRIYNFSLPASCGSQCSSAYTAAPYTVQ